MRKRSKYRPKPVLMNPLGYVIESMTPVAKHDSYLVDLKIKNSDAMYSLLHGTATKTDINTLIAMSNMTEALHQMGFGKEYQDVCVEGRFAILSIVQRAGKHGRFTPTGPEIQMFNLLMELHDVQMDVITTKDMERALEFARIQFANKKMTVLPKLEGVPL